MLRCRYLYCILVLCHRVVEQLGGKQLVMTHLSHEDPNVRYEALLAVQKLMVHNWYLALLVRVHVVRNLSDSAVNACITTYICTEN